MNGYSIAASMLVLVLLMSHRRAGSSERVVVFRLGRFWRIAGPGAFLAVPFIDKAVRVDLPTQVPHWRSLSAEQLDAAIKDMIKASSLELPGGGAE